MIIMTLVYWFTSNLVVGVYIGFDNPKTLGNLRQAQKLLYLYLKILYKIHYLKKILTNLKYLNIYLTSLNYDTGKKSS